MVVFRELRITNDAEKLIIDILIDSQIPGDEHQKIDQIWIDNSIPNMRGSCPIQTDNAILLASINNPMYQDDIEKFKDAGIIEEAERYSFRTELLKEVWEGLINFPKEMCHVFVVTSGVENTICKCNPNIGTVANMYPFYQESINYMKELLQNCVPPKKFIDLVLKLKAVEYSIRANNYGMAHYLWDNLSKQKIVSKSCGCNDGILY